MIKQILLSVILALAVTACNSTANLGSRVKNVEIGMTKQQIISILGSSYETLNAVKTPEGTFETLKFYGGLLGHNHIFTLCDGKLVEYYKEVPPPTEKEVIENNHKRRR